MALKWRWLLVALAAVTVGCLVPGSMVSQTAIASHGASIEAVAPTPSGSECAAVACNRGSPSAPVPLPALVVVGMVAAATMLHLSTRVVRRARTVTEALPEGDPLRLLRPPQPAFSL